MLRCEANEAAAYRSIMAAAVGTHGHSAFAIDEAPCAVLLKSPLIRHAGVFNRVLGLGLRHSTGRDHIRKIVQCYRDAECGLALDLVERVVTADLRIALREMRIRRVSTTAVVSCVPRLQPRRKYAARVVRAQGAERRTVADICADTFSMPMAVRHVLAGLGDIPGWTMWLAYVGNEPAGAALSFVHGKDCWFGWAATRPEFRGRGVKSLISDCRLAHAVESGCEFVSSEVVTGLQGRPGPSIRDLHRCGFSPAYTRGTYLLVQERPRR